MADSANLYNLLTKTHRVCEVSDCVELVNSFSWPKEKSVAAAWTRFVLIKRKDFTKPDNRSRICHKHFKPEDFHNYGMFQNKLASRLFLKKDAIPSFLNSVNDEQTEEAVVSDCAQRLALRGAVSSATEPVKPVKKAITLHAKKCKPQKQRPPVLRGVSVGQQTRTQILRPKRRSVATQCDIAKLGMLNAVEATETRLPELLESDYESEYGSCGSDNNNDSDEDWVPDEADIKDLEENTHLNKEYITEKKGIWFDEPKLIVDKSQLEHVLMACRVCAGLCTLTEERQGAFVGYKIQCLEENCRHMATFTSTPKCGRFPVINAILSGSILFNGCLPSKTFAFLHSMNVLLPTEQTFYRYQKNFLHGIMRKAFQNDQNIVRANIKNKVDYQLDLAGDGRCDSPGHSALYGMYTLMDTKSKKIVACEMVKSTEVKNSNAMELEGLKRCRTSLESDGLKVNSLTTDRHISVESYMRKEWPEVIHYFDLWHIAKGLKKKLLELGKKTTFQKVGLWIRSIINHLYWSVHTTEHKTSIRQAKWKSLQNHMQDIHHHDGDFPACEHGHLPDVEVDDQGQTMHKVYCSKGGIVSKALEPILDNNYLCGAIAKAGKDDTGELESFHSNHNRNCPKMIPFSMEGMISRAQLSVLHHNENCMRPNMLNLDGTPRVTIVRKKANNLDPTVYVKRAPATHNYRDRLFMSLEEAITIGNPVNFELHSAPTLASKGEQATKEEVIQRQSSRGLKLKPQFVRTNDIVEEGKRKSRKLNK